MAKKSLVAKDRQRRETVARFAARRAELKKTAVDQRRPPQERAAARLALQRLPRNASPTRLRNRDVVDGRPRGYLRTFGLSRIRFRDMAHRGELPGITKSSW